MKQNADFTKEQFINLWGKDGYIHTWDAYDRNYKEDVLDLVRGQLGSEKNKSTLEIGAGGGYWTNHLMDLSKSVVALDIIEKPAIVNSDVVWLTRDNLQFDCKGIDSESIDFVFSYGVFCHFSIEANTKYLTDIKRVMKKGATAILMYAEENAFAGKAEECASVFGHTNNYETTIKMVEKIEFEHKRILDFRHTLLLLTKK